MFAGSHGAGLPSETLTPLVVWGSGVTTGANCTGKLNSQQTQQTKLVLLFYSILYYTIKYNNYLLFVFLFNFLKQT